MTRQAEDRPATVPLAQQAGAIPAEWLWVKPCAWTIRMLTALIMGVKEQKWFRLFDKVFAERNSPSEGKKQQFMGCVSTSRGEERSGRG